MEMTQQQRDAVRTLIDAVEEDLADVYECPGEARAKGDELMAAVDVARGLLGLPVEDDGVYDDDDDDEHDPDCDCEICCPAETREVRTRPVTMDTVLGAINALPEAEKQKVLAQLRAVHEQG